MDEEPKYRWWGWLQTWKPYYPDYEESETRGDVLLRCLGCCWNMKYRLLRILSAFRINKTVPEDLTECHWCGICGQAEAWVWAIKDNIYEQVYPSMGGTPCLTCLLAEAGRKGVEVRESDIYLHGVLGADKYEGETLLVEGVNADNDDDELGEMFCGVSAKEKEEAWFKMKWAG